MTLYPDWYLGFCVIAFVVIFGWVVYLNRKDRRS